MGRWESKANGPVCRRWIQGELYFLMLLTKSNTVVGDSDLLFRIETLENQEAVYDKSKGSEPQIRCSPSTD